MFWSGPFPGTRFASYGKSWAFASFVFTGANMWLFRTLDKTRNDRTPIDPNRFKFQILNAHAH